MIEKRQFSQLLIFAATLLVVLKPDTVGASIAFVAAVALLGFEYFLERSRHDEIEALRSYFNDEISKLKNKTDEIILKRTR